jgi:hypothetical protein
MLSIEAQNGDIVFYSRIGQPVSNAMSVEQAIAYLRGDNERKTIRLV